MDIGKVARMNRPDIWPNSQAFTAWLKGNIQQLGEVLNIPLEDLAEASNDILAYHTEAKGLVLIISQLEAVDLGQVMIDIADSEASTIVLIIEQFSPEHQRAVDWLNKNTIESLQFFAVQLEVWKIGDSAVAPKFEIAASPGDRGVKPAEKQGRVSDKQIIAFINEHPKMRRADVATHLGISERTVYNALTRQKQSPSKQY